MEKLPYVTRVIGATMLTNFAPQMVKRHVGWQEQPRRFFGLLPPKRTPVFEKQEQVVPVETSDTTVDSEQLAVDIAQACNELVAEGYEVVKIIDVLGGNYKYEFRTWEKERSAGGFGLGYSLTDAVILIARYVGEPETEPGAQPAAT